MLHIQQNSIRYMGNKLPLEEEFSSSNEFPTAKHRCSKNTPWFRCGETILHMINLNYYFRTTAYFLLLNYPFALHLLTSVYSLWNAAFVCQRHRPPRWQSVLWDREREIPGKRVGVHSCQNQHPWFILQAWQRVQIPPEWNANQFPSLDI